MDFRGDERGQPVQIGFILLFGILVLSFATYQGYVVPNQNAEIEFNHFGTVEDQFTKFHSDLVNSVGGGGERSGTFSLGVQYPARLLALNPPPVSGTLRTTDPGLVSIGDAGISAGDICRSSPGNVTTKSVVYEPEYNEFGNAESITYENTVIRKSFSEGNVTGDQHLVKNPENGDPRIDLLLLTGSVPESATGTVAVNINGTERYARSVEDRSPVIVLPSEFSESEWRDLLSEHEDIVDIDGIESSDGRIFIPFENGDYRMSCAVAGLDTDPDPTPSPTTEISEHIYDVQWESSLTSQSVNSPVEANVSVRTRNGAPVEGATVDFATADRNIANFTDGYSEAVTREDGVANTTVSFGSTGETEVFAAAGDDVDVTDVIVSMDDPPVASIDDVDDESDCRGIFCLGRNEAEFDVQWSASDDIEVRSVELSLVDDDDDVVATQNPSVSGPSVSGEVTLENYGGFGRSYTIRLTVTDSTGQEDTVSVDVFADGD